MPLAEAIAAHRDRIVAELTAAHDYYESSRIAWWVVAWQVELGGAFSVRNPVTGSRITQADLANMGQVYVTKHLAVATLQQFVSLSLKSS